LTDDPAAIVPVGMEARFVPAALVLDEVIRTAEFEVAAATVPSWLLIVQLIVMALPGAALAGNVMFCGTKSGKPPTPGV
jgi:hypothetical protein